MPQSYMIAMKKINHFIRFKGCNIICDDFSRTTQSRKDIVFKEFSDDRVCDISRRGGFYPFGKVFCGSEDPFMLGRGWGMNLSNEV